MKHHILTISLILTFTLLLSSCVKQNYPKPKKHVNIEKKLMLYNRRLVYLEQKQIKDFIKKHHLKMDSTGTGMWYKFLKHGNGQFPKDGDQVIFAYQMQLLNHKLCNSKKDTVGIKRFTINHSYEISGLNEALQMMDQGSEAIFIIPPYLAYGLSGDGKCIPPYSTLIYKIKLLKIIK